MRDPICIYLLNPNDIRYFHGKCYTVFFFQVPMHWSTKGVFNATGVSIMIQWVRYMYHCGIGLLWGYTNTGV